MRKNLRSSSREAYTHTLRLENGDRKSLLILEKSAGFHPFIVSFTVFAVFESFFIDFQTFSVLPNVTDPFSVLPNVTDPFSVLPNVTDLFSVMSE